MKARLISYGLRHAQVLIATLGQLIRSPLPTVLTAAMLGIALSLPVSLMVLVENLSSATEQWRGRPQVSLFLEAGIDTTVARRMAADIERRNPGSAVTFLSATEALDEFKQHSGFGAALDILPENPLPAVLVVRPADATDDPDAVQLLARNLRRLPGVELVQLDLEWVQRLHALLELARRGITVLAVVLGFGVLLIISNTTRLAVLNRRDEIEIINRIGGTPAFVRRPFLYAGLLQGVLGAVLAWLVVRLALGLLSAPIHELATLYGSNFVLSGMSARMTFGLLVLGGVSGWAASRLTVGRHLRRLRPDSS